MSTSWRLLWTRVYRAPCTPRLCTHVYHAPCTRFFSYTPQHRDYAKIECHELNGLKRLLQSTKDANFLASGTYQQRIQKHANYVFAPPVDRGFNHVTASPLLDVLYVSVQRRKSDNLDAFKVYGNIQLIDDQNHKYDVYSRESDNPETVSPGGNLSLFHPDGTPSSLFLPCVSSLKMRLHLKDGGKVIAKGDFDVQLLGEEIKTEAVDGDAGDFATVQYATLPYATVANLELSLSKKDESHAHIYGNIYASSKLKDGSSISSVVFDRPPSEPMMVEFGEPIRLHRDALAVPAYSCIQFKMNLWEHLSNQQIASDVIVAYFEAGCGYRSWYKLVLGQNYDIQVELRVEHAYYSIFLDSGVPYDHQTLLCGQIPSLMLRNRVTNDMVQLLGNYHLDRLGLTLVEVFSISITPYDNVTSHLCGTIKVYDAESNDNYIFDRNISNPEILDEDKKIKSIKWPSSPFQGVYFGMDLNLTDDAGHEVCRGCFDCNVQVFSVPRCWYDKRMTSVIRGKHGYATVHYAIFHRALRAKVKVLFIPNRLFDVPFKISGKIVARYSGFDYSSYSEKMYCQSTLFEDNQHVIAAGSSPLMLQKSEVPVPICSSLIVDMKLQAQIICESPENVSLEHFESLYEAYYGFYGETCLKRIKGENFHIDVLVEWTTR